MSTLHPWLSITLAGLLLSVLAPGATGAPPARKTFGGRVLEVQPKERWFLMEGGASKKYPQVRITHDRQTRWTGVPLHGRPLQIGERVQVIATPTGDVFRAQVVEVQDPNARPGKLPLAGR